MAKPNTVQLGDLAMDTLSGFEGVVVGVTQWLNACRHIGLKPKGLDKDGKPRETQWFDEPQIEVKCPEYFKPDAVDPGETGGPVPSGLA